MTSDAPGECFVYITLPGQTEPVTAGRFALSADRRKGVSCMAAVTLERPKQGALDGSAVREGLAAVTILTKAGPEKYRLDDGAS
jgi:hypothetical protein